jgi:hypothetical protein
VPVYFRVGANQANRAKTRQQGWRVDRFVNGFSMDWLEIISKLSIQTPGKQILLRVDWHGLKLHFRGSRDAARSVKVSDSREEKVISLTLALAAAEDRPSL